MSVKQAGRTLQADSGFESMLKSAIVKQIEDYAAQEDLTLTDTVVDALAERIAHYGLEGFAVEGVPELVGIVTETRDSEKCGGCNYSSSVFYRLEDVDEQDAICGNCFARWLADVNVNVAHS